MFLSTSIDLCLKYLLKSKCKLTNLYSEVKLIITDIIPTVSNKNYHKMHKILCEVFGLSEDNPFSGKPVLHF